MSRLGTSDSGVGKMIRHPSFPRLKGETQKQMSWFKSVGGGVSRKASCNGSGGHQAWPKDTALYAPPLCRLDWIRSESNDLGSQLASDGHEVNDLLRLSSKQESPKQHAAFPRLLCRPFSPRLTLGAVPQAARPMREAPPCTHRQEAGADLERWRQTTVR